MDLIKKTFSAVKKNLYVQYLWRWTFHRRMLKNFLEKEPNVIFDKENSVFFVYRKDLTWNEKIWARRSLVKSLKWIRPTTEIKLKDIITGYYDRCLEQYLFQRLQQNIPNEDTCWFRLAQNNKCIGWVDPHMSFDDSARKVFLSERKEYKAKWDIDSISPYLERREDGFVHVRSSHQHICDSKILALYRKIKQEGFDNKHSSLSAIILGYSTVTGRYNVISGRHRVAVLRYMLSQHEIDPSLKIKCHVIKYDFDSLVYTRPYQEICKQCNDSGIFDYQKWQKHLRGECIHE